MSGEKHYYIISSGDGNRCRTDDYDAHVHCKDRSNDANAIWVFYDQKHNSVEPRAGGTYYIKNYGTSHWINCYEQGSPLLMEMQKDTMFTIVTAKDGFELHFGTAQKSWTVLETNYLVKVDADEGWSSQMFRFTEAG